MIIRFAWHLTVAAMAASTLLLTGCVTVPLGNPASPALPDATLTAANPDRRIVVTLRNPAVRTAQHLGSTPRAYDASARYQVSPVALRDAAALAVEYRLRRVMEWPIEQLGVHCVVFELGTDAATTREELIAALRRDRRVESVQPLVTFQTRTTRSAPPAVYDDVYAGLQTSLATLAVSDAHRWSRGRGVRIAVIDTALDAEHPDLRGRVTARRDFVGRGGGAETHATAVAGIISATANNGLGIVGVAPEAELLGLRACWQPPPAPALPDAALAASSSAATCNTFTLAQAISAAIADGARIFNLSLTGPPDPLLQRLLARALALGRIIVSAWPEAPTEYAPFPASMPGVIAAMTAEVSVNGPADGVRAPGQDLLTLRPGDGYDFASGSSLAAAQITGIAALVLAREPRVSAGALRAALLHSESAAVGTSVNACRTMSALVRGVSCGE